MSKTFCDVLVVGAGPVGLFCANELSRQGLTCRIIEKKASLSDKSKALGIHIRSLDMLQDCDFLPEIMTQGLEVEGVIFKSAGKELINANFSHLEANHHFLIDLPQDQLEQILYQGLIDKGLSVEWLNTLINIEENAGLVKATVAHVGSKKEQITARWLIACDGSHSTVRNLVHADFIGGTDIQSWWLADLHIDWTLPENKMIIFVSDKGPLACFPIGNKRYRLVMTAHETIDLSDPTFEDIKKEFYLRCSEQAQLSNPIWISRFGIMHKQIKEYRQKQVFFAGDAAHVHSPMGGQGLNTGMQDIYNLVWKLALVNKGLAGEVLLDSYQIERHPIAKAVIRKTSLMTKMITLKNPLLISLRNKIMKTISSFAVSKNFMLKDIAELSISYVKSPINRVLGHKTNFKVGEFLIDYPLIEAQTNKLIPLGQVTKGTMHHLFLFAGRGKADLAFLLETAHSLEKQFDELLKVHLILAKPVKIGLITSSVFIDKNQGMHQHFSIKKPTALLIRPDKYIGMTQTPLDPNGLVQYLQQIYR